MKHVLCGALPLLFLSGCSNEIANNSGKARQTPVGTSPSIAGTSADPTTGLPVPVASTSDTAPIATDAPPVVIAAGEPGPTALRRLTNDEYRNSVKDLLLLAAAPTDPLLPDSLQFGYENFASVHTVPPVLASQYATAAARVALEANIAALAPCATPASQALPPPPPNVVITVPAADPTLTTRERFARHTSDPACAGCHSLIDPVGFGLENYDAIGAFRTSENGHPVDSQGALSGTDVDGPFSGGTELANKLAASATMRQCAVLNAARWAFGRSEIETDRLVATTLEKQLGSTGMDVRELLVALAKTDSFRERTLQP